MSLHKVTLTALLLTTILTGCSVGPDYKTPTFDLPSFWHQSDEKLGMAVRNPQVEWWQDFNDQDLNTLVEKALAQNENLQTAASRVVEARALREATASSLYPKIDAAGGLSRGDSGVGTRGGDLTTEQAAFDASWELDLFGKNRRRVEAQDATIDARKAAYENASLSLVAEVLREYITIRQLQSQIAITRQTTETQKQLFDITGDRFKNGLVSQLDVAQSETLYQTTAARIPNLEAQINASSYRLSVLLGENPGSEDTIAEQSRAIPSVKILPILESPSEILRQRPDVAEAERNLAAATALQGVAISQLYPDISISGLFGLQRGILSTAAYAATGSIWSAGANITMPVLDFGNIEGQIKASDARQAQAVHQYRQSILVALADVETSLSNLNKESVRKRRLQSAAGSAEHAVSIARDRYRRGLSDFTTVLQSEQQRFNAQNELILSQSAVAQNIVALHKALGENPAPQKR